MSSKRTKPSKADISDKVKEIKQKQQNWFQQREKSKLLEHKANNESQDYLSGPIQVPRKARSPVEQALMPKKTPVVGTTQVLSRVTTQDKKGFQNWLELRQTESRNFIRKDEDAEPLEEEMFASAADKIASRVKREMQEAQRQPGDGDSEGDYGDNISASGYGLDSHRCHKCNKLMVAPKHSPTLIIPCGHTYCIRCSSGTHCPGCGQPVQSLTNNIMLQQIISQYVQNKSQDIHSSKASSGRQSTRKPPVKDYGAEYQQLSLRCEVLRTEGGSIEEKMQGLDGEIQQQQRQIAGIDRQEARLLRDIEELKNQISQLRLHRQDFQDTIEDIEARKQEQADKLKMVHITLAQLTQDMNQAKVMANKMHQDIT